jgi:hypothetical protein
MRCKDSNSNFEALYTCDNPPKSSSYYFETLLHYYQKIDLTPYNLFTNLKEL